MMEFGLDGSAEEAMRQIEEKQYALPFALDERGLFKIGVNFDNETRNIAGWLVNESIVPFFLACRFVRFNATDPLLGIYHQ